MIELFALIDGLHVEEAKMIKGSFKKTQADNEGLFMQELYSIVSAAKGQLIADEDLSVKIYGKEKLAAVAKLKSRLFQFLLEILSSDAVLTKEALFDNSDRHVLRVRKKMLQFRVLYRKKSRANTVVLYHLLSEIIKEAKEYELYELLVEAIYFKKTMLIIRNGFSEIKPLEKQIEDYHYAYRALLKANDHYFELIIKQDLLSETRPGEIKDLLRNAIVEIEEFIRITDSASIKYIHKLLQLEELVKNNKHDTSIDVCMDILEILKIHKHIYRKERVGFVYDNISLCHVYRGNIDESVKSARQAQEYYLPQSFNMMISKQQEFLACFYGGSFSKAHSIIVELLEFPVLNAGEFRHDKYLFFEALTIFKLGNNRKALIICNQALKITKDKSRWDLGIRYLRIMCMIELQEFDQADSAIEALRKTMKRNDKDAYTQRDELIYRALNEFASTSFSGTPTSKLVEFIKELSDKDSVNSWNYYTHELIPVHEWIGSKIDVKPDNKKNRR